MGSMNDNIVNGPFEIGITDFLVTTSAQFTGGRTFAFNQSSVRTDMLMRVKTVNIVDFIKKN